MDSSLELNGPPCLNKDLPYLTSGPFLGSEGCIFKCLVGYEMPWEFYNGGFDVRCSGLLPWFFSDWLDDSLDEF